MSTTVTPDEIAAHQHAVVREQRVETLVAWFARADLEERKATGEPAGLRFLARLAVAYFTEVHEYENAWLVDLPDPTVRDGDHHVWEVDCPRRIAVHAYLEPHGPLVELHDATGEVLATLSTTRARQIAAALIGAAQHGEQADDERASTKQDTDERRHRGHADDCQGCEHIPGAIHCDAEEVDWKAEADARLAIFPGCADGTCDCNTEFQPDGDG